MNNFLVFVDTNILLDFYRMQRESGLSILRGFDRIHNRLITTYQVEMEFKKNRQTVIYGSRRNLKSEQVTIPAAFLADTKIVAALKKSSRTTETRVNALRVRLDKVLANPTKSDPVYQIVQRLFINDSPLNLKRTNPVRRKLKRAAFRRFILGYPPRKDRDMSMGDALNWEWIVQVAIDSLKHIAIVSRDSDYGIQVNDEVYVNDWLIQEFRDRVSKNRKCLLFDRLAPALELAGVKVGKKAAKEEKEFARRRGVVLKAGTGHVSLDPASFSRVIGNLLDSPDEYDEDDKDYVSGDGCETYSGCRGKVSWSYHESPSETVYGDCGECGAFHIRCGFCGVHDSYNEQKELIPCANADCRAVFHLSFDSGMVEGITAELQEEEEEEEEEEEGEEEDGDKTVT